MTELAFVDVKSYDIDKFDIDPASLDIRSFTAPDGEDITTIYVDLTYGGQPPFFLVEGDSYGVQKANNKNDANSQQANTSVEGMVQLPSTQKTNKKKVKWQTAIKLSEKPAEKDWTDEEKRMIEFIGVDVRKIIATILSRPERIVILQKVIPKILEEAQRKFQEEAAQDPSKYPDQETQLGRIRQLIYSEVMGKISNKVYRKKKKPTEGQQVNLLASAVQYDQTKHPTLYSNLMHYTDKTSKEEVFITKFYQYEEGVDENQWKELTHAEVVAKGWQRFEEGIRFDKIFIGNTISPQMKIAELVCKKDISGGMGHKGRLVRARGDIKKNQRLVKRSAITPVKTTIQDNNNNNNDTSLSQEQMTNAQNQDTRSANGVFDSSVLSNIPNLQSPNIVTDTTN